MSEQENHLILGCMFADDGVMICSTIEDMDVAVFIPKRQNIARHMCLVLKDSTYIVWFTGKASPIYVYI